MRKLLIPLALAAAATTLGLVWFAPAPARASTSSAVLTSATTTAPTSSNTLGETLFENTCSTCHGVDAQGSALAPNLHGVGAATVDLWLSSGWMPLANPTSQPTKKPPLFDRTQTIAIANFVASLDHYAGPAIPSVDLSGTSLSQGQSLFSLNCAPCHTITGAGDALSNGLFAPPLHGLSQTEVAEAIETGPGNMPRFGAGVLDGEQALDVVAYVTKVIEHPVNPGGLGLGGVGPVAEGFIGLFIGVGACLLAALWVGDRTRADEDEDPHGHGHGEDPHSEVAHA
jgi:ubiquinol-cytochrome c reductase cytochrome c subunit